MDRIDIESEKDIVVARTAARNLAGDLGFSVMNKTRIATAVSELARNVLVHGGGGYMEMEAVSNSPKTGVRCVFVDHGPGIGDIQQALSDGFSTGNSLGQGLPGAKRLVDDLQITSELGQGTRVEMVKWK